MTDTLDTSGSFPPPTGEPAAPAPDSAPVPPSEPAASREPAPDAPVYPDRPTRRHHAGHVVAIVIGALALLPGFGLLAGGTALAIAQGVATDDGYFTFTPDRIESDGVAVITDDAWLDDADDGAPWVFDWLDLDVRLRAEGAGQTDEVFIGIARTSDVEAYLADAGYSIIDDIDGHRVVYGLHDGDDPVAAPTEQDIWVASAAGTGEQELTWDARGGRWSMVVMNADGSPDVAADVQLGVRSDAVTPIAVALIVVGGLTLLVGIALVVIGARGRRTR